mmetsp:Transcript_2509/g.4235  ORF Transcript_2509/g.4235 Transcript_2509/m.4235 type:complete len:201 (+) Transcript_2509:205-807(+)
MKLTARCDENNGMNIDTIMPSDDAGPSSPTLPALPPLTLSKGIFVLLPEHIRRSRDRRCVTFRERVAVQFVRPAATLVQDNNKALLWYQQEEYQVIRDKSVALIAHVERSGLIQHNYANGAKKKYCTRGLEKWMSSSTTALPSIRTQAIRTVLNKQYVSNDAELASLYKLASIQCIMEAQTRAKQDVREVEQYLSSEYTH